MAATLVVSVVDDDESVRESLPDLLMTFGYTTRTFASAEAFLVSDALRNTGCLIVDVAMPRLSGPELLRELAQRGLRIPTIFITAHADESLRQRLLEQGAVACLFKPFSESALLQALNDATSTH